jgi:CMP-N-acetylneuraminic acid synthetase
LERKHQIIALICCRGGSKGIPGKNIKEFAGIPLLGWILKFAREANVFDEIFLSTDSEEIAAIGKEFGATVPELRPAILAKGDSDQFDTHQYFFDLLEIADETHIVCILTNNPFIDANLIQKGFATASKDNFSKIVLDSVKVGGDYTYYRQCYEYEGSLWFNSPKLMLDSQINRQTIAPTYTSINNMRWGKPSVFKSYEIYKKEVVLNGFVPVWLPKTRNFDIDDMDDWIIAEAVFQRLNS